MTTCRSNITTYTRDYYPKKNVIYPKLINNEIKWKRKEFRDPISESYRNYLTLKDEGDKCSEEVDSYYDKAKGTYPFLSKVTENNGPEKDVVKKDQIFDGRTVYQCDYCDLEKEVAYREYQKKNAVVLPLDIYIPLTTQKSGYRNPKMLNSRVYDKDPLRPPRNNLEPNHKLREILRVTTGDSEYMTYIGKLGDMIVQQQLHGEIKHYY